MASALPAALEVQPQRAVAADGEALLQAERARLLAFAEKVVDAAGVGMQAPARRRVDERAHTPPGADAVAVLEVVVRAHCRFPQRIEEGMAAAGPRGAGAAVQAGDERLAAVLEEGAVPASRHAPGARLEEIVARGERQDVDRYEALDARGAVVVVPERHVEELDLRAAHIARVRVDHVVVARPQLEFLKRPAVTLADAQAGARGAV